MLACILYGITREEQFQFWMQCLTHFMLCSVFSNCFNNCIANFFDMYVSIHLSIYLSIIKSQHIYIACHLFTACLYLLIHQAPPECSLQGLPACESGHSVSAWGHVHCGSARWGYLRSDWTCSFLYLYKTICSAVFFVAQVAFRGTWYKMGSFFVFI